MAARPIDGAVTDAPELPLSDLLLELDDESESLLVSEPDALKLDESDDASEVSDASDAPDAPGTLDLSDATIDVGSPMAPPDAPVCA
ncbi:hypothetical protein IWW50_003590 [Coemansia erecta]|nr:hypothetical protein IWW50_003590 [Coemansia erecta]